MFTRIIVVFSVLLVVSALEQDKDENRPHHGPHGHGPPMPGLGPLHAVLRQLSETQRQEIFSQLKDARTESKAVIKSKVDKFVATLSPELQKAVQAEKNKHAEHKKQNAEKVKSLSAEAQTLFDKITALIENDAITFDDEHKQVDEYVRSANSSVLDEFRKAEIHMPGLDGPHHGPSHGFHGHGPHGHGPPMPGLGPLHAVLRQLSETQRQEIFSQLKDARTESKAVIKSKVDKFVATLSPDLQKAVQAEKDKCAEHKKQNAEKVKTLSAEAQTLFEKIRALIENDAITFDDEHKQVDEYVRSANSSVLDEFRKAEIHMPGLGGPHHGPSHGFHGHGPH